VARLWRKRKTSVDPGRGLTDGPLIAAIAMARDKLSTRNGGQHGYRHDNNGPTTSSSSLPTMATADSHGGVGSHRQPLLYSQRIDSPLPATPRTP
jgi:hypothetical protein